MNTLLQVLLLVGGFIFLIKGADWLVSGASSVAQNFKVSKLLIGLTIIAFGTGAPELAVSISALASGSTDMVLGNVIGSNILNILLLIGVGAVVSPIFVRTDTVKKELPLCLLISTLLVVLFLDVSLTGAPYNAITRSDGIVCVLFFAVFIYYLIAMARRNREESKKTKKEKPQYKLGKSILITIIGLVGVVIGSQMVVNGATEIARIIGVSERVIALTVIAFGTSLPELVTTITAAKKNEDDLLVGNIIGSNIFNICVVLGIPVALFGAITPKSFEVLDLVMLIVSAVVLYFCARSGQKITRAEGAMMLVLFASYYSIIVMGAIA